MSDRQSPFPAHVAIIMDGNRRWAKERGLPVQAGHWQGMKQIEKLISEAKKMGIKRVTLFAFSTENWERGQNEVSWLMRLFKRYLLMQRDHLVTNGVRLHAIGNLARLPKGVQEAFHETIAKTAACKEIDLVLAINYGGRDEICRAASRFAFECVAGNSNPDNLTERQFEKYLDTAGWRAPDLLIRTSGEMRLSNFMLWQLAYSEIVVLDVKWPDFSGEDLQQAALLFKQRERRFGGVGEQ